MQDKTKPEAPTRREFFKKAGLGAGAAVVGAAAMGSAPKPAEAAEAAPKSQGYRETEHVKRVYELSKF